MMKSRDCAVATALIINGYLRANDDILSPSPLVDALRAVRGECNDWAENLSSNDAALEPAAITVELLEVNGGTVSRSPYNLLSAAVALAAEAVDLSGLPMIDSLVARLQTLRSEPATLPVEQQLLVDAANELAADIDAAESRPVLKLAVFDNLCAQLRAQGLAVEDRVNALTNW